jgi:hypothetical protein
VNLKELLSGLGPLGVASAGVDEGFGDGADSIGVGLVAPGETPDVPFEPPHAVSIQTTRHAAHVLRTWGKSRRGPPERRSKSSPPNRPCGSRESSGAVGWAAV